MPTRGCNRQREDGQLLPYREHPAGHERQGRLIWRLGETAPVPGQQLESLHLVLHDGVHHAVAAIRLHGHAGLRVRLHAVMA